MPAEGRGGLDIRDLVVTYPGPPPVRAVAGVSLRVEPGECLGMLGESGSGKSVTALSILRLIRPPGRIEAGSRIDRFKKKYGR